MFSPSLQSSLERDCDFICPTGNIHIMRESRLIHPVCLQCRHLGGHCTVANADWSGDDWRGPPDCRDRHKNTYRDPYMRPLHTRTTFTGRYRGVHRSTPLGSEDFLWKEMTKKGRRSSVVIHFTRTNTSKRSRRTECGKK